MTQQRTMHWTIERRHREDPNQNWMPWITVEEAHLLHEDGWFTYEDAELDPMYYEYRVTTPKDDEVQTGQYQLVLMPEVFPDLATAEAAAPWPEVPFVHVEEITVEPASVILTERGETVQLTATLSPEGTTNQRVIWSSSDDSVATVSQSGLVAAKTGGEAIITARTADDGHTAHCIVAVNLGVTTIEAVPDSVVLEVGNVLMLSAVMYPADAHDMRLDWTTDNYDVASVIDRGRRALVHAYSPGYAEIKATCRDGGHEATCSVIVRANEGISIDKADSAGEGIEPGEVLPSE